MKNNYFRKFKTIILAAVLSSCTLISCGKSTESSYAESGNASEQQTEAADGSENSEAEQAAEETLFDTSSDALAGTYHVNTDFLGKDDYILQMSLSDGKLVLYTENYSGTGDSMIWIMNPYTGELLSSEKGTMEEAAAYSTGGSEDSGDKPAASDWNNLIGNGEELYDLTDVSAEYDKQKGAISYTELRSCGESTDSTAYFESAGICMINGRTLLCIGNSDGSGLQILIPREPGENDLVGVDNSLKNAFSCESLYDASAAVTAYTLRMYDLTTGEPEAEQTFTAGFYDNGRYFTPEVLCYDTKRETLFIAGFGDGYEICAWKVNTDSDTEDPSEAAAVEQTETEDCSGTVTAEDLDKADDSSYSGYISAVNVLYFGNDDLADLRAQAETLYDKYGAKVLIGEDTDVIDGCEQIYDPVAITTALGLLDQELGRYPEGIFLQLAESYGEDFTIHLYGTMTEDSYDGTMPESIGGVASGTRIAMDITEDSLRRTINHEMYHILEWHLMGSTPDYFENWTAVLPEGFSYTKDYSKIGGSEYTILNSPEDPENVWFIDDYATMDGAEDMARTFEYAMLQEETGIITFSDYPHLTEKLQVLSDMLRAGFNTEGWPEITAWEEPLEPEKQN